MTFIRCKSDFNENKNKASNDTSIITNFTKRISYQIVHEYQHDTLSYVEGLQYVEGEIYESCGNYKKSNIRIVELTTGKVLKQHKLDKKYFAEGITVLRGKAYQLTWKENTCFVYNASTFFLLKTFKYDFGEGWGMTTDGKYLIVSNGSSSIFFIDPETFKIIRHIDVNNQYGSQSSINELEYIKGFIYANVYLQDIIIKIDPINGNIIGEVDMSDIRKKYNFPSLSNEGPTNTKAEVMNGIAYDSANNRIFITGKYWPMLLEVKLDN